MKKLVAFVFGAVLLLGASTPLAAQLNPPAGCIQVKDGDSLWRIADRELHDPLLWESRLYDRNPKLSREKRRTVNPTNGWTYVLIHPNELLCGLQELGIATEPVNPQELRDMGFKVPTEVQTVTVYEEEISPWIWLLLLIILALVLWGLYRYFRRDPTRVGAGRVRENGIQTPAEAATHFREQLTRELGSQLQIISLVRGRAYGWARVIDRSGSFFRRILSGEPTWQVTVRQGGRQEIRYSLMGCANDVRGGGGMMPGWGFRFVADENVTDQIQPAPAATAPTNPPAATTMAPAPSASTEPAPAPAAEVAQPKIALVPLRPKLRVTLSPGGVYGKLEGGYKNLVVEEFPDGSVVIRADR